MVNHFSILSIFMYCMLVLVADAQQIIDPTMKCGDQNTLDGNKYKTWDTAFVCLVFPDMPGGPKKVLYNPKGDRFEVL